MVYSKKDERTYEINGQTVKVLIDYKAETILIKASGFERTYPMMVYLRFPGNVEEFAKDKVFPHGY